MGRVVGVGCVIWRVLQICRDVNEHLGELVRVWGIVSLTVNEDL